MVAALLGAALAVSTACGGDTQPSASTARPPSNETTAPSSSPTSTFAPTTTATTAPASTAAPTTTTSTLPATTSSIPAGPTDVLVYFLRDELLRAEVREVPVASPEVALEALLTGPTPAERAAGDLTIVPPGTRLLGVDVAGNEAVVDLSGEFAEGGGSLSLVARVMQVVFTVTQFPGVEVVRFRLDGEPVVDLGGEGLYVDGLTRDRYDWVVPFVLLERPASGAVVGRSIRLVAWTNAAGASLRAEVIDASGVRLLDLALPAPAAAGEWAVLDTVLASLPAGADGPLTLRLSDPLADPGDPRARPAEVAVTV